MRIKELGVVGEINLKEDLTNYIFSVQSLIDRLYIMKYEGKINFDYIDTRVEVIEKFEDEILLKIGGIK